MAQILPPPDSRSRGSSPSAAMNRYTSEYTTPPPPPPQAPGGGSAQAYNVQTRPRGPSLENYQIPSIPPYPLAYDSTPNNQLQLQIQQQQQLQQQQASYPGAYQTPPYPTIGESNALRPPLEQRRGSVSSTHSGSRRSHDSHRSRSRSNSHRSSSSSHRRASYDGRERRSHDSHDRDYDDRHHHSSHHHHSSDNNHQKDDHKPITRVNSHRPTFGDSIFAIWDYFKGSVSK